MNDKRLTHILAFALGFTIALCVYFALYSHEAPTERVTRDTVYETIVKVDTMIRKVPKPKMVYKVRTDTMTYVVTERDTIYVPIPIERKEYRTDEYFAVVEGYKPSLTYIETYNKTVTQTNTITRKVRPRFGLGLHVGYGTDFRRLTPYVGVGLTYNFITF